MGSALGNTLAGRRALVIGTLLGNRPGVPLVFAPHGGGLGDLGLDLARHGRMGLEIVPRRLAALADPLASIREPGPALVDDIPVHAEIDQLADLGNPFGEQDVELGLLERRRHLVLHHLHAHPAAHDILAVLDGLDPADVEPDRGVELQRVPAGGRLGVAEHDADLHADLVDNATVVCEREIDEVSFRSAWDMSRACRPMWASPISPSSSARGTSAATESITMMSTAPLRTRVSVISSACSPVSGCDTSRSAVLTPNFSA